MSAYTNAGKSSAQATRPALDGTRAAVSSRRTLHGACRRGDALPPAEGPHAAPRLTRDQERSLWLHRAVIEVLLRDPDATLSRAHRNLVAWRDAHRPDGMSRRWLDAWDLLIQAGPTQVELVLTSREQQAVELRQNSPFAGVLDDESRKAILVDFAQHWRTRAETRTAA